MPLALLLADWSPVVVVVLLLSDWLPVEVVLSMVRLERPRRSMSGVNEDVDPVCAFWVLVDEPVIDALELGAEPEIEGLTVLLPAALAEGLLSPLEVDACSSGMQSMCTGLFECSFALPVSLFASLPACG